jgi:hypothetical protein
MRVKRNDWFSYEGWLDKKMLIEVDYDEITLEKLWRDGARGVLVHMLGAEVMLGMTSKDKERLFSFLSEAENEKQE